VTATDHLLDGERYAPPELARAELAGAELAGTRGWPPTLRGDRQLPLARRNGRVRVICAVPASDAKVPSLNRGLPRHRLCERETYDLFGIGVSKVIPI